jgi:hypothetical protein
MSAIPPPVPDAGRIPPSVLIFVNGFLGLVALAALIGIWFGRTPVRRSIENPNEGLPPSARIRRRHALIVNADKLTSSPENHS